MTKIGKKSHFNLNFINSPFTLLFALCSMPSAFLFSYNVAILTRPPGKRRMDNILEKLRVFGGMRVMAVPAINDTRIYIDMSLSKSWAFKVMAIPA